MAKKALNNLPTIPDEVLAQMRAKQRPLLVFSSFIALLVGMLIGYYGFVTNSPSVKAALTPPPDWQVACEPELPDVRYTPLPTKSPPTLSVYITGAVQKSQVVNIPAGSLLQNALDAAGGPTTEADLETVNLAQPLHDNQHIIIPHLTEATTRDDAAPQTATGTRSKDVSSPSTTALININTASVEELETLPRIGPSRAQDVITYRMENGPFAHIEDLQNVAGIGPATFKDIAPLITITP